MHTHAILSDDIDALKAMIRERDAAIAQHEEIVVELRGQVLARTAEIEHLKLLIAKLKRMQFGRKSEKLDHQIEQLELKLEDLQADEGESISEAQRRQPTPAHPAAATCVTWVATSPNNSNSYRPASRSCATSVRRWHAPAAIASCRHRHRAVRSSAAWPARGCWRMCWYRSLPIICRSTGNR